MSVVGDSPDLKITSFSGSLGSITSSGSITDSTLKTLNITYISANSSTCTAPLNESLDSQESIIVVSTVSSIFNSLSYMKLFSILSIIILFI